MVLNRNRGLVRSARFRVPWLGRVRVKVQHWAFGVVAGVVPSTIKTLLFKFAHYRIKTAAFKEANEHDNVSFKEGVTTLTLSAETGRSNVSPSHLSQ